jgi:hypothetical protein
MILETLEEMVARHHREEIVMLIGAMLLVLIAAGRFLVVGKNRKVDDH